MNTSFALCDRDVLNLLRLSLQINGLTPLSGIIAVFIGGIVGFLINYFSDVLPIYRRIIRPVCKNCGQPYSIKGYLLLFKCTNCGSSFSNRSILVIIGSIISCLLLVLFPFSTLGFWAALPVMIFLGVIVVIDIEHRIVVFQTSVFGFVLFFIYGIILNNLSTTLWGAVAGFFIMLMFFLLGKTFARIAGNMRGQQIDEVAFGFGDVCVGVILGLLIGWPKVVGAIIVAIILFSVYSIFLLLSLIITKKYHSFSHAQPFTPFLILGMITLFYL